MRNITSYLVRRSSAALILLFAASSTANAVITLTFADNLSPVDPFPSQGTTMGLTFPNAFASGKDFRMITPGNTIGGGGEKSNITGGEQWVFGDDFNLTAVVGTEQTGGAAVVPGSAEPGGGTGLFLNAPFFFQPFGFLAPTVGSPAAALYGNGTITVDLASGTLQAVHPVLEAQWADAYFPLGLVDDTIHGDKITFNGILSNIQLDVPSVGLATFDFVLAAEHVIALEEDPASAGFSGWTAQWNVVGSGVAPIVILNPPSSTDAIAATLPGTVANDGRITQAELVDVALYNAPVDTEVSRACVGSCFAFTVTGVTGTTQVVLPLSAPIPDDAVYRKLIGGSWVTFDESTGDILESGLGAQGDCSGGVVYSPGLTAGDYCIRLSIADSGPNDDDGSPTPDGVVIDPGGVGVLLVSISAVAGPSQSIDDAAGCSISKKPGDVRLFEKADWLLLAGFILALAIRRKMRASTM